MVDVVDEHTQEIPDATTRFLAKQLHRTTPGLAETLAGLMQLSEFEIDGATRAARRKQSPHKKNVRQPICARICDLQQCWVRIV